MANTHETTEPQASGTRSGKELAIIVGLLLTAAAATIVTYQVRSRATEEAAPTAGAPAAAPGEAARPAQAAAAVDHRVVHTDVYFDVKSARLRADATRVLQETAAGVDRTGPLVVLVQGHADHQGPREYNRVLAERRAESVKQFLVELGIPDTSVKVLAIGQDGALCDDASPECQQLNRRVHVEIRRLAR